MSINIAAYSIHIARSLVRAFSKIIPIAIAERCLCDVAYVRLNLMNDAIFMTVLNDILLD